MTSLKAPSGHDIIEFAAQLGIGAAADISLLPLAGGVSSDVFKAQGPRGAVCIKQALPTLRVARRWDVPIERSLFEQRWLKMAYAIVPQAVPRVLRYDADLYLIGMQYFPPEDFPNWRSELLAGRIDPTVASALGHIVGKIHAASADNKESASDFASDSLFDALRIDPYFRSLLAHHSDLAGRLDHIIQRTAATHRVVVHGDVSPKNILCGSHGPILLDAECAWFGDPAFDVAFPCSHWLLKIAALPAYAESYAQCFADYLRAYETYVRWESLTALRARTADLLGAMLLARIDGTSPVDYLSANAIGHVRCFARLMIEKAPHAPLDILESWRQCVRTDS